MSFADVDARIVTAFCLCIIGFIVMGFTLRVWWTPPLNRVFLFGPYLTEEGLRTALRAWPMLFLLGALALSGGVSRFVYFLRWRSYASDELAAIVGLIEASLSLWACGAVILFAIKVWTKWHRR